MYIACIDLLIYFTKPRNPLDCLSFGSYVEKCISSRRRDEHQPPCSRRGFQCSVWKRLPRPDNAARHRIIQGTRSSQVFLAGFNVLTYPICDEIVFPEKCAGTSNISVA